MCVKEEVMTDQQVGSHFTDLVERGVFRPLLRHFNDPDLGEERLQEGIAFAWTLARRTAAEEGRMADTALLVHHAALRARELRRTIVPADGRQPSRDVMSPAAYREGHVEVLRLDGIALESEDDLPWCPAVGWANEDVTNPERHVNSAVDLDAWLSELTHRDRHLMEAKAAGYETTRIAADLGLKYGVVYRRQKKLGRELAVRAGVRIAGPKPQRNRRRGPDGVAI